MLAGRKNALAGRSLFAPVFGHWLCYINPVISLKRKFHWDLVYADLQKICLSMNIRYRKLK